MGDLIVRAEALAAGGAGADRLPKIRCLRADQRRMEGSYAEAWRVLEAADSLPFASDPANLGFCLAVRSELAGETGRDTAAIVAARRGIALKDSLGERRDGEYLTLLDALGSALGSSHRPREAVEVRVGPWRSWTAAAAAVPWAASSGTTWLARMSPTWANTMTPSASFTRCCSARRQASRAAGFSGSRRSITRSWH